MTDNMQKTCSIDSFANVAALQKEFFNKGHTLSLQFRIEQLKKLHRLIRLNRPRIIKSIELDCRRAAIEIFTGEIAPPLWDIAIAIKNLKNWARQSKYTVPLINRPACAYCCPHPFGSVLIIGPWNQPFGLLFTPLVAALSAGNCAILKPSELMPCTSRFICQLIGEEYDPGYITAVEGGPDVGRALIHSGIDFVFFTGGVSAGRSIACEAADLLIPSALELGGKNPCIIDSSVPLATAARRIAWGKYFNAGQTCIAPDFCLVNEKDMPEFETAITMAIESFYGKDPSSSQSYARIINDQHFYRLERLIRDEKIITGGITHFQDRYIAPTVVTNVSWDSPLMKEEIFGPILPVLPYNSLDEVFDKIKKLIPPLVFYCFTKKEETVQAVKRLSMAGNICFNGTLHLMLSKGLPFGGVGRSGWGRYHGKSGFDLFSYQTSILSKSINREFSFMYPPYRVGQFMFSFIKKVFL
jgi:acyl-CoA reductase-like NAD-dependent aldehyde dehydrogenase